MINPKDIPEHRTRKDLIKHHWHQIPINRKSLWFDKRKVSVMSRRLLEWRTIWDAMNTPIKQHGWSKEKYDWSTSPINQSTYYERIKRWRSHEMAFNTPAINR